MEREIEDPTREERLAAAKSRMAELATKFLNRSLGDLAVMRAGLQKLAQGDAEPVVELRQLAHRMVGTGATLGFESIAQRAHAIEALADGCAPGAPPDENTRLRFSNALDALDAELRHAQGT